MHNRSNDSAGLRRFGEASICESGNLLWSKLVIASGENVPNEMSPLSDMMSALETHPLSVGKWVFVWPETDLSIILKARKVFEFLERT